MRRKAKIPDIADTYLSSKTTIMITNCIKLIHLSWEVGNAKQ